MDEPDDRVPLGVRDALGIVTATGWRTLLRDAVLVVAWVGATSHGWGLLGWPAWAYYVVVFGGIVAYSLASEPWGDPDGGGG